MADGAEDQEEWKTRARKHRNCLKMFVYAFFLAVNSELKASTTRAKNAQNKKGKKEKLFWERSGEREKAFSVLVNLLEIDLVNLWGMNPEEEFLQLFSNLALWALENPTNSKDNVILRCLASILSPLVSKYGYSFQITISLANNLLCKFDHAVPAIREILSICAEDHDCPQLAADVLREVANIDPRAFAKDTVATKNMGAFINELGILQPRIVLPAVSSLLALLDGEVLCSLPCVVSC